MADELKDQRIPIMMSPSEVKAIDDWMFQNRRRSRADSIRSLVQQGLLYEPLERRAKAADNLIIAISQNKDVTQLYLDWTNTRETYLEALSLYSKLLREHGDQLEFSVEIARDAAKKFLEDKSISAEARKNAEENLKRLEAILQDSKKMASR